MATIKPFPFVFGLIVLFLFAKPTLAFGAGNIAGISKVEGVNWRHGDIEDTLLHLFMARAMGGKKFDKLGVSRVYFGNWLRDYSQAIDVGTVKSVSAEAIRLLLCVLGFMSFGYGSKEFEVTAERLGCYRPEDHIDNPKNYADNLDAREYDPRLRGPVNERVELAIDPETGMKNYIANERVNIMTSALHVRRLFAKTIELGRSYQRSHDKAELYEALRLMGTGLHCLEDFLAHSNYLELALIELGERDIFPQVGRATRMRLPGARNEVYPCVTGTFGGVDFLHSVTGEVSDKLTQNEIDELQGTLQHSQTQDTSMLQTLLGKIPDGILGGGNKQKMNDIQNNANAAQMQNMHVSPRQPEEFTRYIQQIFKQVMPVIEFHDEIVMKITEAIEKIPILPQLVEQLEDQLSIFVFSIIAPFIVPVINQIKSELQTGSSEIIESSENEQHVVFRDDRSSDPTHSMLSKDHFSNILNEIAGSSASKVLEWVVPQLMQAWDDHNVDIDRTLNRIIHGVMHHPAQRDQGEDGARDGRSIMFRSVQEWWGQKDEREKADYRRKLSREGVERGENHKEGVHDTGHGCGKPLTMQRNLTGRGRGNMENSIVGAASGAILGGLTGGLSGIVESGTGMKLPFNQPHGGPSSSGRGEFGGGLGGILGAVTGSLLGGGFNSEEIETQQHAGRTSDGGYTQTTTQYGHSGNQYAQAEYTATQYAGGGQRTDYARYEQNEPEQHQQGPHPGGNPSYQVRTETRWSGNDDRREEERNGRQQENYGRQQEDYGRQQEDYGRQQESYGRQQEDYGRQQQDNGRQQEDYGRQQESYGRQQEDYGRQEDRFGRQEDRFGRQEDRFGQQGDRFGQQGDRFGQHGDRFGQQGDRFGQHGDRFGRQDGRLGLREERLEMMEERFGHQGGRFGLREERVGLAGGRFGLREERLELMEERSGRQEGFFGRREVGGGGGLGGLIGAIAREAEENSEEQGREERRW